MMCVDVRGTDRSLDALVYASRTLAGSACVQRNCASKHCYGRGLCATSRSMSMSVRFVLRAVYTLTPSSGPLIKRRRVFDPQLRGGCAHVSARPGYIPD
eukprot:5340047-Prymnesium_polylepis.1